jgi:mRNA-degrading endonuclease toxin of MazEF toxin-antitoxin module
MVAPVSTNVKGLRGEVLLGEEDGMPLACAANLDSLETIAQSRLERRITSLSAAKLRQMEQAIHFTLALGY